MTEITKDTTPRTYATHSTDDGSSLLPMLISSLILISIGYAAIMIFV